MNAHEVLKAARELITDRNAWTQNNYAKDADGKGTGTADDNAVSWCAYGAISHVCTCKAIEIEDNSAPASRLIDAMGGAAVSYFNDNHTHGEVLAAFDKAIEATRP